MIEKNYDATDGVLRLKSEVLLARLDVLNGTVTGGRAGVEYPLPPTKAPEMRLIQVNAISRDVLNVGQALESQLPFLLLTLYDVYGGMIFQDMPISRLSPRFSVPNQRPLYIRPQLVDARRSFILPTFKTAFNSLLLEFVYAL